MPRTAAILILYCCNVPFAFSQDNQDFTNSNKNGSKADYVSKASGIEFVLIKKGDFSIGNTSAKKQGRYDFFGEDHTRKVTISKDFLIGKYEVTQKQWNAVMTKRMNSPWKRRRYVVIGDDMPASYVSWHYAQAFCKKLSELDGKTYRLPTEAEWEYACRAGTQTTYHYGNDFSGKYSWHLGNSKVNGDCVAHSVGRKLPNPFGLYDMHGNVAEWCQDQYRRTFHMEMSALDPVHAPIPVDRFARKVVKGGSAFSSGASQTAFGRNPESGINKYHNIGLRIVCGDDSHHISKFTPVDDEE